MKKILFIYFLFANLFSDDVFITINATSYNNWVYYSISEGEVLEIEDPENSLEWDLAFQRKHIRTNSGLAGIGNAGAYVDSSMTWIDSWDSINNIPNEVEWVEDDILNDFYEPISHLFYEGIKNPALNAWGWFDDNYHLNLTNYVFFVKCANGIDVIKFWPYSYYQNNLGGHVSIRYETGFLLEEDCPNIVGDINNDNQVNVVDIVNLVSFILELSELDECQISVSDINEDGVVNVVDIVNLVSIILN